MNFSNMDNFVDAEMNFSNFNQLRTQLNAIEKKSLFTNLTIAKSLINDLKVTYDFENHMHYDMCGKMLEKMQDIAISARYSYNDLDDFFTNYESIVNLSKYIRGEENE